MRLSLKATMIAGAIFAIVCFGVAFNIISSIGEIEDPTQAADAQGFAMFWTFLGLVAGFFAGLAWWMIRHPKEGER